MRKTWLLTGAIACMLCIMLLLGSGLFLNRNDECATQQGPPPDYTEHTAPGLPTVSMAHTRMGYLASYPRSGNHLTRALIEYLTGQGTSSRYKGEDKDGIFDRAGVELNTAGVTKDDIPSVEWQIEKIHSAPVPTRSHFLIVLQRDPYEAMQSELKDLLSVYRWFMWAIGASVEVTAKHQMMSILQRYVDWPDDPGKLLLHYEDYHERPAQYIRELGTFFGVSEERIQDCIEHRKEVEGVASTVMSRKGVSSQDDRYYHHAFPYHAQVTVSAEVWPHLKRYETVCIGNDINDD